jgi:hypothetical protein
MAAPSTLLSNPGLSSDSLKGDFRPIHVPQFIDQLAPDEGIVFDPLHPDRSFQIEPDDIPDFKRMILIPESWL